MNPLLPPSFPGRSPLVSLTAALLALALGGCDLFDSEGPSYSGVVVDAETESPIENIQVSLQVLGGGIGSRSIVAEDLTDAEGAFRLRDPIDRANASVLFVNAPEYGDQSSRNPLYDGGNVQFDFGDRHDIRIELRRLP